MAHPTHPETRRSRRERATAAAPLPTRRELRERTQAPPAARGRRHPPSVYLRRRLIVGGAAVLVVAGMVSGATGIASLVSGSPPTAGGSAAVASGEAAAGMPRATVLPAPAQTAIPLGADGAEAEAVPGGGGAVCDDPAFREALDSGSDSEAIAAAGGPEAFRSAISSGTAPCVDLRAADRTWVLVNKTNALDPIDYWPEPQARAEGVERTSGGHMRADVAAALSQLVSAARDEGAGEIGVNSGFRSYDLQVATYRNYVGKLGQSNADLTSARPGHSEHQTGLAVDVVACDDGCGTIEGFGGTPQSDWVAANAHRFGFIVRYGDGDTATTGYEYEPWHLRYIGPELAGAYASGGFRTLEDFFGMPPAPDYAD
ncbi:M15 family metallopeptidase [Microbacterium thalli]|uniref:M15 family metallopeptidase n=1 Tax=Microbacterium thalli TaxID=3027921 RepID=A0ABT5SEA6_9MICO|nr:M15 family metallopeptidase [Microbacterium thalli]MDD7961041.1 M15 family metallopeptidase [Microbacterium thalli]